MKMLLINSVCGIGSTGRICVDLAQQFEKEGYEVKIAYGRDGYVPEEFSKYAVRIGNDLDVKLHGIKTRLFDEHGFGSIRATKKFLEWAEKFDPDILWLHNIHGYYINIELLFQWIKTRPDMQVKWTLHDCWAFTGHCAYFSAIGCTQWKVECSQCMQTKRYPSTLFRKNVRSNFERKKNSFLGVKNLEIITPSYWLADLVKQSFLQVYPVEVQYNSIDKEIFKPVQGEFRNKYNLENQTVVLGVANVWDDRKGLDDFYKLADLLGDDYSIVLVGLSKEQIKKLPNNIIGIERTKKVQELVEIYSAADIFVNPSKEETFGMTTVEALYCGTTVIVYKDTACEEIVNNLGGYAVEQGVENIAHVILNDLNCYKSNE